MTRSPSKSNDHDHDHGSSAERPKSIEEELSALKPTISAIAKTNGTPGISIGVMHRGEVLTYYNFGLRNVESSLQTSEHTMYHIASVGKFITAIAISNLVAEGLLGWDEPLQKYLPCSSWYHPNDGVREKVTIRHCLAHTTGLSAQNRLWLAERGRMNFGANEASRCISGLEKLAPVGQKWLYNNWGYVIAAKLIKVLTGKSWGNYLKETIFEPLGMRDTVTDANCDWDDVALGYMALTDGTPIPNGRPAAGSNACQAGSSGVQTSVHDLMLLYKELYGDEKKVIKSAYLLEKQIDLEIRETINGNEQSYAMGWVRTQLPGVPSMNPRHNLVIGKATSKGCSGKGPILLHHNGNYPGYVSAAFLLPDTETAVVVMANSVGKIEIAEIVGQMIIETILNHGKTDECPQIDWVGDAQREAAAYNTAWKELASNLEKLRLLNTVHLPLESYVGKYYNNVGNWYMEIFPGLKLKHLDVQSLWMCMQGNKKEWCQVYQLKHYHCDTFSWLMTLDESVCRGRSPICSKDFYLLKFQVENGIVTGLKWSHDSSVKDSLFTKKN